MDEKSQVQALDRSQPVLPMMPGVPERRTHDYARHGVAGLFAAFNIADGTVISELHGTATRLVPGVPEEDRQERPRRPRRSPDLRQLRHPQDPGDPGLAGPPSPLPRPLRTDRVIVGINQVERWFGYLTDKKIRRGVHSPVQALEADIRDWIQTSNQDPRPFAWTKTAEEILDSLGRIYGEDFTWFFFF